MLSEGVGLKIFSYFGSRKVTKWLYWFHWVHGMDRVIWYKTGAKLVCVVPLKKKSSILSVGETSLEMLSCAITRSLGYNGHKEVTFSSWTVKLPVICNHWGLPIVCRITSKNYLDDLRWHYYCISFSGESGVFSQCQDGTKTKTETGLALGYDGGGTLKLGKRTGHELKFTGFNLWDRVLPPEEIKQMANSFTKGTGTVKNLVWFRRRSQIHQLYGGAFPIPVHCSASVWEGRIPDLTTGKR